MRIFLVFLPYVGTYDSVTLPQISIFSPLIGIAGLFEPQAGLSSSESCKPTSANKRRTIVYSIFLLEALHSFASTHVAWALLCDGWGNPDALKRIGWDDALVPLISGIGAYIWTHAPLLY